MTIRELAVYVKYLANKYMIMTNSSNKSHAALYFLCVDGLTGYFSRVLGSGFYECLKVIKCLLETV